MIVMADIRIPTAALLSRGRAEYPFWTATHSGLWQHMLPWTALFLMSVPISRDDVAGSMRCKQYSSVSTTTMFNCSNRRRSHFPPHLKLPPIRTGAMTTGHVSYSHRDRVVVSIVCSPKGDRIASCSFLEIMLWDVETGSCLHAIVRHQADRINMIAFSPQGDQIASSSRDYKVQLWDVETGVCYPTLTGHDHDIVSVAFRLRVTYLLPLVTTRLSGCGM
jgi:WD40 repeat protein